MRITSCLLLLSLLVLGPARAGITIEFLGQRFIPRVTSIESLGGVAFDPEDREIVSLALRDVCGDARMEIQSAGNGACWDVMSQRFWYIDNDRDVYRLVNGTKDLIFNIPENFDVPGVGQVTLDRPEGIATDMNHVYVVDAGPSGTRGDLASNEWFKFERDGTPVACSETTDFQAELTPHFAAAGDCVVDGIAWIPGDAPYGNGLFLVAVEHSGIQVIDENGMYVDRVLWQDQRIPAGGVPFGFAGVTIDPLTGNLYLVENGGTLHVWERLVTDEAQSAVYGISAPKLHLPASDCDWPMPAPAPPSQLLFSLAYRDMDELLWSIDFEDGEVYAMDPRYPLPQPMGSSGILNAWGMAYDDERDVFYVFRETGFELYALDPTTLQSTMLPTSGTYVRELAFHSDDKGIYGIGGNPSEPVLIRFDRDTGVPLEVGPTVWAAGIGYDRVGGALIAHGQANSSLYAIDPTNGNHLLITDQAPGGWEGIAVIPIASALTAVGPTRFSGPSLALRAFPNPLPASGQISFELARAATIRASVFDLAGRRVAQLHDGPLGSGPQQLLWDGRTYRGRPAASGVYLVRVQTPWTTATQKITLLR